MDVFSQIPDYVRDILSRLASAGHGAYAVGGCVRDTLMGRTPHDWDVTTSASDKEIMDLFEKTAPTGLRYGTVTVILPGGRAEVTTFRRDGAYRDSRRPETVEFVGDLREDLSRRDFTVNAMAMDARGRVTDLFDGRGDLHRRLIRCVGDPERRFTEDALRMLRAVRFSAQLGFHIEAGTLAALQRLAPLAGKLSAERIRQELSKALDSDRPEKTALMIEYGLCKPFISNSPKRIPLDRLRGLPRGDSRLVTFALLCHLRGLTPDPGELLRSLRCPASLVKTAAGAAPLLGTLTDEPEALRAALALAPPEHVLAACGALGFYASAQREIALGRYVTIRDLAVSGAELQAAGMRGPEIGEALRNLALAVTAGEIPNEREALLRANLGGGPYSDGMGRR